MVHRVEAGIDQHLFLQKTIKLFNNPNITILDENLPVNQYTNMRYICDCGKEEYLEMHKLISRETHQCKQCASSEIIQNDIREYLSENSIEYHNIEETAINCRGHLCSQSTVVDFTCVSKDCKNRCKLTFKSIKNSKDGPFCDECRKDVSGRKRELTNMLRYGSVNVMGNPEIAQRQFESSPNSKPYTLPSGKVVFVEGSENFALDYLFSIEGGMYDESDIFIGRNKAPTIKWYDNKQKEYTHHTDIFIRSQNKIIEAKGRYWHERDPSLTFVKKKECEKLGYKYEIWFYDRKGNLTNKLV